MKVMNDSVRKVDERGKKGEGEGAAEDGIYT